jgi:hypothetical protein
MSDAEFADYMKDFCTLTDEGKNLKEPIMRLRARGR